MKRYKSLTEDFLNRVKIGYKETEVYVNPKSVKNFSSLVRGFLDKKGNLYIWNEQGVIHIEILPYLVSYLDLPSSVIQSAKKDGWLHYTLPHGVVSVQGYRNQRGTFVIGESNQLDWMYRYEETIQNTFGLAKKKNPNLNFVFKKKR